MLELSVLYSLSVFLNTGAHLIPLVLELYHPVWVIVKHCPEMVTLVHGCQKNLVAFVLFDDALIVAVHQVGETILCFLRDWSDECGLHDVLVEMCII